VHEVVEELDAYAKANGVARKDIAERANMSLSSVSRFFSGRHSPQMSTLGKVATALGLRLVVVETVDANTTP